jgi:hypothetical protein
VFYQLNHPLAQRFAIVQQYGIRRRGGEGRGGEERGGERKLPCKAYARTDRMKHLQGNTALKEGMWPTENHTANA